jgi:hypothetical protein
MWGLYFIRQISFVTSWTLCIVAESTAIAALTVLCETGCTYFSSLSDIYYVKKVIEVVLLAFRHVTFDRYVAHCTSKFFW